MTIHGVPFPRHEHVTSWTSDRNLGRELCRRHGGALARVASLILGDDAAADEVVSDTIAAVCRFADRFGDRDVTRVYLARSVYHRCRGLLAAHERIAVESRGEASTLSDDQRAVVALVLFGDHDLTQAATTLDLSPTAVIGHLRDVSSKLGG